MDEEWSFYYVVPWTDAHRLVKELRERYIPYALMQAKRLNIPPNHIAVVFPDLPVRLYAVVRELFGGDGVPYPQ